MGEEMLNIIQIQLDNFRGKKDYQLNFADEMVTIIHGNNGSGKTTLLRIIHGILNMNDTILANENIREVRLIFNDRSKSEKRFLSAIRSEEESEYTWQSDIEDIENFIENYTSIVFGVNRGVVSNSAINKVASLDIHKMIRSFELTTSLNRGSQIRMRMIEDMAEFVNRQVTIRNRRLKRNKMDFNLDDRHLMIDNLSMGHVEILLNEKYLIEKKVMSEKVQNALFETLAQVLETGNNTKKTFNELPVDFEEKLVSYRETLLELLSELEGNKLSKKIIKVLEDYDGALVTEFEGNNAISNLIYNMIIELEKGKGIYNTVAQLVEEFNEYISIDKKLIVDELGARIEIDNVIHEIEKLSSGERHLLSFLTLFIIEGSKRRVLMIDEPEISLNLEWQSKLLKLLTKFSPNSQIIVATHSPAIAEFNTNSLVEIG